jgi:hypothetical protein
LSATDSSVNPASTPKTGQPPVPAATRRTATLVPLAWAMALPSAVLIAPRWAAIVTAWAAGVAIRE